MAWPHLSKQLGASAIAALSILNSQSAKGQISGTYNGFSWQATTLGANPDALMITGHVRPSGAITIPSSINGIPVVGIGGSGFAAFNQDTSLTSVMLPDSLLWIGDHAFGGCTSLTSLTIPDSVSWIANSAFSGCSGLTKLTIPNVNISIDGMAFKNCTSLQSLTLPGNALASGQGHQFEGCTGLTSLTFSDGVGSIPQYEFQNCTSLQNVTFPNSVSVIVTGAFAGCTSLNKVCFEGDAPSLQYGTGLFLGDTNLPVIYYINGTQGWGPSFDGVPTAACTQCGVVIAFVPVRTGNVLQPIDFHSTQATNLALVIHGTTMFNSTPYTDGAYMAGLANALQARYQQQGQGANWDVRFYDWCTLGAYSSATPEGAARNGVNIGAQTGQQIAAAGHYKKVLLIGHSSGAWVANEIATALTANNITNSVTFLDAFVPDQYKILQWGPWADSNYTADKLGKYAPMAEQYYEHVFSLWQNSGLGIALPKAANYDITEQEYCYGDWVKNDPHGWPIRWYTHTVQDPYWSDAYDHNCHLGFPQAFNITDTKGQNFNLLCEYYSPGTTQVQSLTTTSGTRLATANRTSLHTNVPLIEMPPLPPLTNSIASAKLRSRLASTSASSVPPSPTSSIQNATPMGGSNDTPDSDGQAQGLEFSFTDLAVLAHGGNGVVSTNADGIQLATSDFVWETFYLNTSNAITVGALDYALSNQCNSVVGMWMDGKPLQFIQSAPQNELSSTEIFPLSKALGSGNHLLTVSLESLDGAPIAATLKRSGFYYVVSPPVITSQSVSNGQFSLSCEVGAGLKYQPQFNNDLTSTNWNNLGGLLTSPTNTIMSAFDSISTNRQRFYRVAIQQ